MKFTRSILSLVMAIMFVFAAFAASPPPGIASDDTAISATCTLSTATQDPVTAFSGTELGVIVLARESIPAVRGNDLAAVIRPEITQMPARSTPTNLNNLITIYEDVNSRSNWRPPGNSNLNLAITRSDAYPRRKPEIVRMT